MTSFAVVFFPSTRTSDIVPTSSIPHGAKLGETTRVRWESRNYKGKILFVGPKEICEMKMSSVSADGELVEDVFDFSLEPTVAEPLVEQGPTPREREFMTRQIRMEEDISLIKNILVQMNSGSSSQGTKIERVEQIGRELLRRNPPKQTQDNLEYVYASAKSVAQLRELKGQNKNLFVLALEKLVYSDDPAEMDLPVDDRILTKDRVIFIKQCLFKYYDVADDDIWRRAKDALNSRVRRHRKALKDAQTRSQNRESPESEQPHRLDLYD